MDTEMEMETKTSQGPTHHDDNVRGLLSLARQLISQGKPSLALQAVCMPFLLLLHLLSSKR